MENLKKRYFVSSSESREIIRKAFSQGFLSKTKYEKVEILELKNEDKIILLDDMPLLILVNNLIIPSLFNANIKKLPFFKVDAGAVPHILNGADVMAPGITQYPNEINEGMIVSVKSENDDFLCIAKVLDSALEKIKLKKGKVLSNLHYKNDKYYEVCIQVLKKSLKK
jgi:PUA domain protein